MKNSMVGMCLLLCFLALIIYPKAGAAVSCGAFYSVGEFASPSDAYLLPDDTTVIITITFAEGAPVDTHLYTVYWNDTVSSIILSDSDTNDGMTYMEYIPDYVENKMDVFVIQSMSGIVDYDHPDRTKDHLEIYLDFVFEDLTTCRLGLDHTLLDDNTKAPHFNDSTYSCDIREDFPLYLEIPGLKLEAYDYDATEPSNTFKVSLDPECPLKVSMEVDFICYQGQPVSVDFVLTRALDYDTMLDPQQIICVATLQDYGTPSLLSSTTIFINVIGYPDELPQFTSNYYIGTLSSDLEGTIVDVNPQIIAVDEDVPSTNVMYTMNTADPSIPGMLYFAINDSTAEVFLIQDLAGEILAYEQVTFFVTATDVDGQVGYSVLNVVLQTQLNTTATCEPCYSFSTCEPCNCSLETSVGSTFPQSSMGSTFPQSSMGSTFPQSSMGSTFPQSSMGSTFPQSSMGSTFPQSSMGSTFPQSSMGSTFPQSSKGSTFPQSSMGSTFPRSSDSTLDSTISPSTEPSNSNIEFLVNGYIFQILTTTRNVGEVKAVTSDGSPVTYSWKSDGSPGLDYFNIGKNTGLITAMPDPTPVGTYDLVAVASSDGLLPAESTVTIVVYAPLNSSYVVMLKSVVYVETPENTGPSSLATLQIASSSIDAIFCIQTVTPPEFTDSFAIDSATGVLSTTKELDADDPVLGNTATILVAAYSGPDVTCGPSTRDLSLNIDQTLVYVTVTDQNDNSPSFVSDYDLGDGILVFAYPKEVSIQRAVGSIGFVHAVDVDVTSTITYSMATYDNSALNYAIDQDTGEIYLAGSFNCFVSNCSMKVIASDSERSVVQPIKIIGLSSDKIHTMILDNVDITDVDATLGDLSQLTGVNIHQLYSSLLPILSTKGTDKWRIQVQVYAESGGQLLNLDDFNRRLHDSGLNTSATNFSDNDAFSSSSTSDNTGYKVAVGILGAALGIIIIVGIVILVKRHRKKERHSQFTAKQISTLGKSYANQINQTDERENAKEETFFTIFGNGSLTNKSRTSLKSTTTLDSNSTQTSRDTAQDTKRTTIEAYNNYALEDDRPYHNGSSSTITKAEVHSNISSSFEEKPKIHSYYSEWEKQQESQQQRKTSADSNNSSVKPDAVRKSSLELYPMLVNLSNRNSRHSSSNSSTNSDESISNIRRASSKELTTEDPDRKSVAFKVLLETKEYEPEDPEPIQEEKSVAFKVLVETKQIDPEAPESQDIFTIL